MQILRTLNPLDKELEQRFRKSMKERNERTNEQTNKISNSKTVRFFRNFKNLLLIMPPFY